ncbi:MAG: ExbD/TolR family protein [Lautropia sp.]|nr:ExbD/TolR family protein [Lautropia sp.]
MPSTTSLRRGRRKRLVSDINVVPYIDVMLVLLVIFMVTAPFVPTSTIDLPTVDATPRQPEPYIEVQVSAGGELTLQTRNQPHPQEIRVHRERLPDELRQLVSSLSAEGKGAQPVVISGDKQVRYETILDVMGDIKQQGIARVGLMVKPRPAALSHSS